MTRILITDLEYWNGSELLPGVTLGYWDGESMADLTEPLLVIPQGYPDVDSMLAEEIIYSAHRGGSVEWPEMSLRAYTQAGVEGFGCLELSLARTSDGVFIGCHDSTLDRVVGQPGADLVVADMTWAEVQTYMIQPPAQHPERQPQPFMRIEELIEAYGASHVIMVDPKSIGSANYASLLDIMDAAGGPQRWLGKWVGSNQTWSDALRARGYRAWGAYYGTDDQQMVTDSQGQWDLLGFNFGADQAEWDFILSFGKPVYAHVCPTQESVDTGIAKGAVGAQVSGTEAVDVYKEF